MSLFDRDADNISEAGIKDKSIQLIAKTPILTAAIWRASQGKKILKSRKELGIAGNFLYLLTGKIPEKTAEKMFDKALILHAEHGFNASTFSARVTISTLSDVCSAITTALGTLKGPLHGGANLAALEQFRKIEQTLGQNPSDERIAEKVAEFVDSALAQKQKMMGIGHAVYKVKDTRAIILEKYALEFSAVNKTQFKIAKEIEENMAKKKNLFSNVDLFSGLIYTAMDIPSQVFISVFAMGRMPGWLAHMREQIEDNKLIRPRAEYIGPELRSLSK